PVEAARCAIAIQKAFAERNRASLAERKVQLRIGLHLADIVQRDNKIFGDGVNVASRIEPLAEPGGICLTQQIYDQVQNKVTEPLVKLGRPELKNIQVPVEIYRLALPWQKAALNPSKL